MRDSKHHLRMAHKEIYVMQETLSKSQSIINEFHQYILKQRGQPADWYVGIAHDTDRLFVDHGVSKGPGWWIYQDCGDFQTAREVEKAFLDWGCRGGGGGGDDSTTIVYAYLITSSTRE